MRAERPQHEPHDSHHPHTTIGPLQRSPEVEIANQLKRIADALEGIDNRQKARVLAGALTALPDEE